MRNRRKPASAFAGPFKRGLRRTGRLDGAAVPAAQARQDSGCGAGDLHAAITVDDDRITAVELLKDEPQEDERGVIEERTG